MLDEYGDFLTIDEICNILDIGKNKAYELLRELPDQQTIQSYQRCCG